MNTRAKLLSNMSLTALRERLNDPDRFPTPQSTIDATKWLMVYHPERLEAWLQRHPPGEALRKIASDQLQADRGRRRAVASS